MFFRFILFYPVYGHTPAKYQHSLVHLLVTRPQNPDGDKVLAVVRLQLGIIQLAAKLKCIYNNNNFKCNVKN